MIDSTHSAKLRLLRWFLFSAVLIIAGTQLLKNVQYNRINLQFVSGIYNQDSAELAQVSANYLVFETRYGQYLPVSIFLSYILFQLRQYDMGSQQQITAYQAIRPLIYHDRTPEYHLYQAINYEHNQDWAAAVSAYRQAFSLQPVIEDNLIKQRYYAALSQITDPAVYPQNLTATSTSNSEQLKQIEATNDFSEWIIFAEPLVINPCWQLTSLRYDRTALELGTLLPIELQTVNTETNTSTTSFSVIENLVPNAGFEWGTDGVNPIGFEKTIYHEDVPAMTHRTATVTYQQREATTAALLDNRPKLSKTSFQSNAIPVIAGESYFMGGWINNDGAGQIGIGWYGRFPKVPNPYYFVSPDISTLARGWQFIGRIVEIPQVDNVDFTLTNFNSTSSVFFDDLFFFKITQPCPVVK